jgi:type I restriction enzyme S subunit
MEVKKGYKQTEVGVIPNDWDVKRINDFSKVVRGSSPRPAGDLRYFNGNFIPWLTVASLTNIPLSQILVNETNESLTEEGSKISRILEKETLIIANSGATLGIAKLLTIKCCANDGIAALLKVRNNIEKRFIIYYLSTLTRRLREVIATGNGQPNLNTTLIGNIQIPIPPTTNEQFAIATVLSETDNLIANLEKLIAKKEAVKKGAMQALLTGEKRLPGFNSKWPKKKIKWLFKFLSTANNSRSELSDEGEIGYIHYGDIHIRWSEFLDVSTESIPFIKKSKIKDISFLENGDLLIADASEDYEGLCACIELKNVNHREIVGGLHTLLLRGNKDEIADGFKGYLLHLKGFKEAVIRAATGISVYGISKKNLGEIEIIIPDTNEQSSIAAVIADMTTEIKQLEEKLQKYKVIKQGMMQNLLTGKIRLV